MPVKTQVVTTFEVLKAPVDEEGDLQSPKGAVMLTPCFFVKFLKTL